MRHFFRIPFLSLFLSFWLFAACDDGDKKQTCEDACEAGSSRCEGTIVQECEEGADGCLHWSTSADCAQTDQTCVLDAGVATCIDACVGDGDCDGVLTADDCDDADPALGAITEDVDCDGVLTADDCDDADATLGAIAGDGDCDGALTADDCDDADATLGAIAEDGDCDGALTADDCDDADATLGAIAEDGDCDGVLTANDCDDIDPTLGDRAADEDCDGVLTADDCDDTDPTFGDRATDADCDRSPTLLDCDDADPAVTFDANDVDCDGVADIVVFQKLDGANPDDVANQDCIVPDVCVTRGATGGLYNDLVDEGYWEGEGSSSPSGTWFFQGFVGQDREWNSWRGSIPNPTWWVMQPMAMRLDEADLDFNVVSWQWTANNQGGGFAWARASVRHFEKLDLADPNDPANQDCVVPGVCLTRGDTQSLFNAALENAYQTGSPAGTEWAPMATRDASPGDYSSFVTATGSQPQNLIGQVMSLHVLGTDIYFDVVIGAWSGGGAGGGFAWSRSRALVVGCPDPGAANFDPRATVDDGYCGDWVRFTVPSDPDTLDPANWDCVTPEVCLTRGSSEGLYNAMAEAGYDRDEYLSPLGTLWADSATADATTTDFVVWREAVDGDPPSRLYHPLSMFIPEEGRFFDVVVLRWPAWSGGGVTYVRREVDAGNVCGDGVLQLGEECDDGNTTPGDGCQATCRLPYCGDGVIDPGETCDEGLLNSDEPGATCRIGCTPAGCSDGILDPGEVCDDGNLVDGDGCDSDCDLSCGRGSGATMVFPRASDGACLLGFDQRRSHLSARAACAAEGGTLVTVTEESDNNFVANFSNEVGAGVWIGFTDEEFEGSWGWLSGAPVTFTRWYPGEPNDSNGEDCAEAGWSGWNDASCALGKPFVCETLCGDGILDAGEECDEGTANSNAPGSPCRRNCRLAASCGDGILDVGEECDDGNVYDGDGCQADCTQPCGVGLGANLTNLSPTDGACFLAFEGPSTFADAEAACVALGGQLATISDAAENAALVSILTGAGDGAWIGFNDRATEGTFLWAFGDPVTYTNWSEWEPNDYYGEDCAQILGNGRWNDNNCENQFGYFCELQP